MSRQLVYFIRPVGGFGPVKIGCSEVPENRLSFLLTMSPYPLEIVATIPGDLRRERQFHALFREHHSHREWFRPVPIIERTIEAINAGTFDLASLPAEKRLPAVKRQRWSSEMKLALYLRHGLEKLSSRGVSVPDDILQAAYRYSLWRIAKGPYGRVPEDAEAVQAFLSAHTGATTAKIIILARECGLDRQAA